jgi:hypothetical protein
MSHPNPTPSAHETMLQLITGQWVNQMISVIARLGLADQLDGESTEVSDVARTLGVNAEALFRIARALSKVGVLTVSGSRIGLTELGRVLREDAPGSLRHLAAFSGCEGQWKTWGELMRTLTTPEPTTKHALCKDIWQHFADHPDEANHFNRAMADISNAALLAAMRCYDFTSAKLVCDVGGGSGSVIAALLEANPKQRAIVVDLPHVIEHAKSTWSGNPNAARCSLAVGDFFASVPEGADLYILKNIIHDWSDGDARRILENCAAAMSHEARLVLLESPLADAAPPFPFLLDVNMMVMFGGRERTPEEYAALLASSGLELCQIVPSGGLLSVIEAKKARH